MSESLVRTPKDNKGQSMSANAKGQSMSQMPFHTSRGVIRQRVFSPVSINPKADRNMATLFRREDDGTKQCE